MLYYYACLVETVLQPLIIDTPAKRAIDASGGVEETRGGGGRRR